MAQKINVICCNCNKEFKKSSCEIKRYKTHFCSRKCTSEKLNLQRWKNANSLTINTYNCKHCNLSFNRKETSKPNKSGNYFCNHSCAAKFNNKLPRKSKISFVENVLYEMLVLEFPDLKINRNNRTILNNGLEIDLLIEEIKFAIEVNGPTHYKPIYGFELLQKRINSDLRKQNQLLEINYQLFIIDVSTADSRKKQKLLLNIILK